MPRTYRVEGAEQLRVLAIRLKAADRAMALQLRRDLRREVQPIADEVKAKAASFSEHIPSTIAVRTRFGAKSAAVWIQAVRRKMPAGHEALPGLQAFGSKRNRSTIRHPSRQGPGFGQEGPWVDQPSHPDYWLPTIRRGATRVRVAMLTVMRETSRVAGFK